MDEQLTEVQIRVLRNLDGGVVPETLEEFEAYVELRDADYCGYSEVTKTVVVFDKGHQALKAANHG